MGTVSTSLNVIGSSSLVLLLSCGESVPPLFGADAGLAGGLPGLAGSGGRGGRGPDGPGGGAGAGGGEPRDGGLGGADAAVACDADADCEDENDCTGDTCDDGVCSHRPVDEGVVCGNAANDDCTTADTCDGAGLCRPNDEPAPAGTACGDPSDDDCTSPDECDGAGTCAPRHAAAGQSCGNDDEEDECSEADECDGAGVCSPNDLPNGSECDDGSCTLGECIEDQPVGCPADVVNDVPFNTTWRTVGRVNLFGGGCDIGGTPDYAVVFTAPTTGTFRFEAAGLAGEDDPESGNPGAEALADSVLTIAEGSCGGMDADQVACSDDIPEDSLDSLLELQLSQGDVVTVYVGELREPEGGSGTLSITLR